MGTDAETEGWMTHVYRVRFRRWPLLPHRPPGNLWHASELAGRFGAPCRVLARTPIKPKGPIHPGTGRRTGGGGNSVLLEFEDGCQVIASRNAVRKIK